MAQARSIKRWLFLIGLLGITPLSSDAAMVDEEPNAYSSMTPSGQGSAAVQPASYASTAQGASPSLGATTQTHLSWFWYMRQGRADFSKEKK